VVRSEPFGAAEHHAGLEGVAFADCEQRFAEEALTNTVTLCEVRGELQAVLVHGLALGDGGCEPESAGRDSCRSW